MNTLDEALIAAWQQGDRDARERVWTSLWSVVYTAAVRYCRRFCADETTARDRATSALSDASVEIDALVRAARNPWRGSDSFVGWVTARVIYRCADQRRAHWREISMLEDLDDTAADGEPGRLNAAAQRPASQETDLLALERDRSALHGAVRATAALREICRRRATLVALIDEVRSYLRERFVAALPPGIASQALTLDELAQCVEPAMVDVSQRALYLYVMDRLRLNRNQLDQRMKHLRRLMRAHGVSLGEVAIPVRVPRR